jgi:hypothetical protein
VVSLLRATHALNERLKQPATSHTSAMAWFTTTSELTDACETIGHFAVLSAAVEPSVCSRGLDSLAEGDLTKGPADRVQSLIDFCWVNHDVREDHTKFVGHLPTPEGRAFAAAYNAAVAFATNDPPELRPVEHVYVVHEGKEASLRMTVKTGMARKRPAGEVEGLAIEEHATAAKALRIHLVAHPEAGVLHNMISGTRLDLRELQNLPARIKSAVEGRRAVEPPRLDMKDIGDLRPIRGFHQTAATLAVTMEVGPKKLFGPLELHAIVRENMDSGLLEPFLYHDHHVYYATCTEVNTTERTEVEQATRVYLRCPSLFQNGAECARVEVCGDDYVVRFVSRNIHVKLVMKNVSMGMAKLTSVVLLLKREASLKN